eukprot:TRINITY_DN2080_c0_g1_i4.p1 TRINITY_DN2080_c0_g1~~TRINITY_DN2080_c0_g1_i4.p1  ORF type:complete len:7466 (-),score=1064.85 TRINITY_DN2080_c0_g1_i4:44-22441(-)
MCFQELPDDDWVEVITEKLKSHLEDEEAKFYAQRMVKEFHIVIQRRLYSKENRFPEMESYSEISIRELLKWVKHILWYKANGKWTSDPSFLAYEAWCIYGSRFRTEKGRKEILSSIESVPESSTQEIFQVPQWSLTSTEFTLDNFSMSITNRAFVDNMFDISSLHLKMGDVHAKVSSLLRSTEFIKNHGLYLIHPGWYSQWLDLAKPEVDPVTLARCGASLYASRLRHSKARQAIFNVFSTEFNCSCVEILPEAKVQAEWPRALLPRVLKLWKQLAWSLHTNHPVLVSGAEGCGKSDSVIAFGQLQGMIPTQICLTPETEPSLLIGQLTPNESSTGARIEWRHGELTQAFENGHWILLDNINQAEASVLERMNPVMEAEPHLVLTEKGEVVAREMHADYRMFATMTPEKKTGASLTTELSPALYNRFSIFHMDDISLERRADFLCEISMISKAGLSDNATSEDIQLVHDLCWLLVEEHKQNKSVFGSLTLRNFTRLIDSTYLLCSEFPQLAFSSALYTAFRVTIVSQFKESAIAFRDQLEMRVATLFKSCPREIPDFLAGKKESTEHILTKTRREHAQAVLSCITCRIPVLLEGPAAVGKTSLISYLSSLHGVKLERVNNTDTTTTQDYLGTYLPSGKGFSFNKGALYRAMENGWWFLADEFNLADPVVMCMLFPLLEGKGQIQIPGTDKVVMAKPGFRFFATQNDATYASRHQLPASLRNRFLEVQVSEFSSDELPEIILRRKESNRKRPETLTIDECKYLAGVYTDLMPTPMRISMREIIKWLNRQALYNQKDIALVGQSLLAPKLTPGTPNFDKLFKVLKISSTKVIVSITQEIGNKVCFREGTLSFTKDNVVLSRSPLWRRGHSPPQKFIRQLVRLAFAVHSEEPVLLIGPTSCKTLLVETWVKITGAEENFVKVHLTPDTEAPELIGQMQPFSFFDAILLLPQFFSLLIKRYKALTSHEKMEEKDDINSIDLRESLRRFEQSVTETFPLLISRLEKCIASATQEQSHVEQEPKISEVFLDQFLDETSPGDDTLSALYDLTPMDFSSTPDHGFGVGFDNSFGDFNSFGGGFASADNTDPNPYFGASAAFDDPFSSDANNSFGDFNNPFESNPDSHSDTPFTDFDDPFASDPNSHSATPFTDFDDPFASNPSPSKSPFMESGFSEPNPDNSSANFLDEFGPSQDFAEMFPDLPTFDEMPTFLPQDADLFTEFVKFQEQQDKQEAKELISPEEQQVLEELNVLLDNLLYMANGFKEIERDGACQQILKKIKATWESLASATDRSQPIFLFRDGPITRAAKAGCLLFLEDFNLPYQSVTERLNSMLEPSPTFALTEDVTLHSLESDADDLQIDLPSSFQVFATVHHDLESQALNLSPATRSRFTEIRVSPYDDDDLQSLAEFAFDIALSPDSEDRKYLGEGISLLFELRKAVLSDEQWTVKHDIMQLFRAIDFICGHPPVIPFIQRVILGMRFFYFDEFIPEVQKNIFKKFHKNNTNYAKWEVLFEPPTAADGALDLNNQTSNPNSFPVRVLPKGNLQLLYTGVACTPRTVITEESIRSRFYCAHTPTLVTQFARVFAAIQSGCPLLLEGPPGIGKTAVVNQIAKLVGIECERLNFSNTTTLDQLLGCIIPRVVNGKRVFDWQDGSLVKAIKQSKWVLLDEVNFASPEVLDALAPLLARKAQTYLIPSTNEELSLKGVCIFATMNPASIGGGRSKLPRSIKNLFATVKLEDYDPRELRIILNAIFKSAVNDGDLTDDHITALFNLQKDVKDAVTKHVIGRVGGPFEFNLRNFSKFRDVLVGNAADQRFHYKHYQGSDVQGLDVRVLSLRKFSQLLYAGPFQTNEDRKAVQTLIDKHFPLAAELKDQEMSTTIDTSVSENIRIGSIYMSCGNAQCQQQSGLVHTKETVRQLEVLGAAVQSRRTILLEGETCSRKTSLIAELSRLTRNKLVVIPMNQDIESSDLIGQWLPIKKEDGKSGLRSRIDPLFDNIMKNIILFILPQLSSSEKKDYLVKIGTVYHYKSHSPSNVPDVLNFDVELLTILQDLLNHILDNLRLIPETILILRGLFLRVTYLIDKAIQAQEESQKTETSFVFVESELIQAIREGNWVLFDNVNSAPPEVIERLNSLMEDEPVLNLYEHSGGEELTLKNGKIHPNFRLFATANLKRIFSNKLSTAFLNRVIHIWLPQMDANMQLDAIEACDLFHIMSARLGGAASKELVSICLKFHAGVKTMVERNEIVLMADFSLSFRNLAQATQTFLFSVQHSKCSYISALVWALLRTYTSSLKSSGDSRKVIKFLRTIIRDARVAKFPPYLILSDTTEELTPLRKAELKMGSRMCLLEESLGKIISTSLSLSQLRQKAKEIAPQFVASILQPMYPSDSVVLSDAYDHFKKALTSDELFDTALEKFYGHAERFTAVAFCKTSEMQDVSNRIKEGCKDLSRNLVKYAKCTSFEDSQKRLAFIERIFAILSPFQVILTDVVSAGGFDSQHCLVLAVQALDELFAYKSIQSWYAPLHNPLVTKLKRTLSQCIGACEERGASWAFQREQRRPILSSIRTIDLVMDSISKQGISNSHLEVLRRYQVILHWLSIQWMYNFQKPAVLSFVPKQHAFTFQKLLRLELLNSLSNVKRRVRSEILDPTRKLLKQFSVDPSTKDQLLEGVVDIKQKFFEISKSPEVQFVKHSMEASDIEVHSNILAKLQELHHTSELLRNGRLDLNEALFSRFGHFLRSLQSSVLRSPLHFIWCGVFFMDFISPDAREIRQNVSVRFSHFMQPKCTLLGAPVEIIFFASESGDMCVLVLLKQKKGLHVHLIKQQGTMDAIPQSWLDHWRETDVVIVRETDISFQVVATQDPALLRVAMLVGIVVGFPYGNIAQDLSEHYASVPFEDILHQVLELSNTLKSEIGWKDTNAGYSKPLPDLLTEVEDFVSSPTWKWSDSAKTQMNSLEQLSVFFSEASLAIVNQELDCAINNLNFDSIHAKTKALSTIQSWKTRTNWLILERLECHIREFKEEEDSKIYDGCSMLVKTLGRLLTTLSTAITSQAAQGGNPELQSISLKAARCCRETFDTLFSSMTFSDSDVQVDLIPSTFFVSKQEELRAVMTEAGVSEDTQKQLKLFSFLTEISSLFGTYGVPSQKPHDPVNETQNPVNDRLKWFKSRIETALEQLKTMISQASDLQPRPYNIIQQMRQLIVHLEDLDCAKLDDYKLSKELLSPTYLKQQLLDYTKDIERRDPILSKVTVPRVEIQEIEPNDWTRSVGVVSKANSPKELLMMYTELKKLSEEETAGNSRYKRIINTNIKVSCWNQALELCKNCSGPEEVERLTVLTSVLSDDLSLDCVREQVFTPQMKDKLYLEYARFRHKLLLEEKERITDYAELVELLQLGMNNNEKPTLFNLFSKIKVMNTQAQDIFNELRSFPADVECSLLPLRLDFADIYSLFIPEDFECIKASLDVQFETPVETEVALSKSDSAALSDVGAHSFVYHNDEAEFLFDDPIAPFIHTELNGLRSHIMAAKKQTPQYGSLNSMFDSPSVQISLALLIMRTAGKLMTNLENCAFKKNLSINYRSSFLDKIKQTETKILELKLKIAQKKKEIEDAERRKIDALSDLEVSRNDLALSRLTESSLDKEETVINNLNTDVTKLRSEVESLEVGLASQQSQEQDEVNFRKAQVWKELMELLYPVFSTSLDGLVSALFTKCQESVLGEPDLRLDTLLKVIHIPQNLKKAANADLDLRTFEFAELRTFIDETFLSEDPAVKAVLWLLQLSSLSVGVIKNSLVNASAFCKTLPVNLSLTIEKATEMKVALETAGKSLRLFIVQNRSDLTEFQKICGDLLDLHKFRVYINSLSEVESIFQYIDTLVSVSCEYMHQQYLFPTESFDELLARRKHITVLSENLEIFDHLSNLILQLPTCTATLVHVFASKCHDYETNPFFLLEKMKSKQSVLEHFYASSFAFRQLWTCTGSFVRAMVILKAGGNGHFSGEVDAAEYESLCKVLEAIKSLLSIPIEDSEQFLAKTRQEALIKDTMGAFDNFITVIGTNRKGLVAPRSSGSPPCMDLWKALGYLFQEFLKVGLKVERDSFRTSLKEVTDKNVRGCWDKTKKSPDMSKILLCYTASYPSLLRKLQITHQPAGWVDWFGDSQLLMSLINSGILRAADILSELFFFMQHVNISDWLETYHVYCNKSLSLASTSLEDLKNKEASFVLQELYELDEIIFGKLERCFVSALVSIFKEKQSCLSPTSFIKRASELEKQWSLLSQLLISERKQAKQSWLKQKFDGIKSVWDSFWKKTSSEKEKYEQELDAYTKGKKDLQSLIDECFSLCHALGCHLLTERPHEIPHCYSHELTSKIASISGIESSSDKFEREKIHILQIGDWKCTPNDHKKWGLSKVNISLVSPGQHEEPLLTLTHRFNATRVIELPLLHLDNASCLLFQFYDRKGSPYPEPVQLTAEEVRRLDYRSKIYFGSGIGFGEHRSWLKVGNSDPRDILLPKLPNENRKESFDVVPVENIKRLLSQIDAHPSVASRPPRKPVDDKKPLDPDVWKNLQISDSSEDEKAWLASPQNKFVTKAHTAASSLLNELARSFSSIQGTVDQLADQNSNERYQHLFGLLNLSELGSIKQDLLSLQKVYLPQMTKVQDHAKYLGDPISKLWNDKMEEVIVSTQGLIRKCLEFLASWENTITLLRSRNFGCLVASVDSFSTREKIMAHFAKDRLPVDVVYNVITQMDTWKLARENLMKKSNEFASSAHHCDCHSLQFNPSVSMKSAELQNMSTLVITNVDPTTSLEVNDDFFVPSIHDLEFGSIVMSSDNKIQNLLYVRNDSNMQISAEIEWVSGDQHAFLKPESIIIPPRQKGALEFVFWSKQQQPKVYQTKMMLRLSEGANQKEVELNLSADLLKPQIEIFPEQLDFGSLSETTVRSVTLKNPLNAPVLVKAQVQTVPHNNAQISLSLYSQILSAHQEMKVDIQLSPHEGVQAGEISQMVYFGINSGEFLQQLPIMGSIRVPKYSFLCPSFSRDSIIENKETVTFPDVVSNTSGRLCFELKNDGEVPLNWNVQPTVNFAVSPATGLAQKGSSSTIMVYFHGYKEGSFQGQVEFTINSKYKHIIYVKALCGVPQLYVSPIRRLELKPQSSSLLVKSEISLKNEGSCSLEVEFPKDGQWHFSPQKMSIGKNEKREVEATFTPKLLVNEKLRVPIKTNCLTTVPLIEVDFVVDQSHVVLKDSKDYFSLKNEGTSDSKIQLDYQRTEGFAIHGPNGPVMKTDSFHLSLFRSMQFRVEVKDSEPAFEKIVTINTSEIVIGKNGLPKCKSLVYTVCHKKAQFLPDVTPRKHSNLPIRKGLIVEYALEDASTSSKLACLLTGNAADTATDTLSWSSVPTENAFLFKSLSLISESQTYESFQFLCSVYSNVLNLQESQLLLSLSEWLGSGDSLSALHLLLEYYGTLELFHPILSAWPSIVGSGRNRIAVAEKIVEELSLPFDDLRQTIECIMGTENGARVEVPWCFIPDTIAKGLRVIFRDSGLRVFTASYSLVCSPRGALYDTVMAAYADTKMTKTAQQSIYRTVLNAAECSSLATVIDKHWNYSVAINRWKELLEIILPNESDIQKHFTAMKDFRIDSEVPAKAKEEVYNDLNRLRCKNYSKDLIPSLDLAFHILSLTCSRNPSEMSNVHKKIECLKILCRDPLPCGSEIFHAACQLAALMNREKDSWASFNVATRHFFQTPSSRNALQVARWCAELSKENAKPLEGLIAALDSYSDAEDKLAFGSRVAQPFLTAEEVERMSKAVYVVERNSSQSLSACIRILADANIFPQEENAKFVRQADIFLKSIPKSKRPSTKRINAFCQAFLKLVNQEENPVADVSNECLITCLALSQTSDLTERESLLILFFCQTLWMLDQKKFSTPVRTNQGPKCAPRLLDLIASELKHVNIQANTKSQPKQASVVPPKPANIDLVSLRQSSSDEFEETVTILKDIAETFSPEILSSVSFKKDIKVSDLSSTIPSLHKATGHWRHSFYCACQYLKYCADEKDLLPLKLLKSMVLSGFKLIGWMRFVYWRFYKKFPQLLKYCADEKDLLPLKLLKSMVLSGFKLIGWMRFVYWRFYKKFPQLLKQLEDDILAVREYLVLLWQVEKSPELTNILKAFKIQAKEDCTKVKDFAMPSKDAHKDGDETGKVERNVNLPMPRSADNAYVFSANDNKEVKENTSSFIYDSYDTFKHTQEEIMEDEDVESIVLENLKISSLSQQPQYTSSIAGPANPINNIKNAAKDLLKKQIQQQQHIQSQSMSSVGQQPVLEVGGKLDYEQESGVNVGTANLQWDPAMMADQISKCNLIDFYKKGRKIGDNGGFLANAITAQPQKDKSEKWTYQLLVECKPLTKLVSYVLRDIRTIFEKFHSKTADHHEFEWCIMVDNSGSMGTKKNQTAEALVVLIEVLRKLECRFAIVRFGNRSNQRLLKSLAQPFDFELGQTILESFSYDEGTKPGTALKTTARTIWGESDSRPNVHRMVLMITDGLTDERDAGDWNSVLKQHNINLAMLLIKDPWFFWLSEPQNAAYEAKKTKAIVTPPPIQGREPIVQDCNVQADLSGGKRKHYIAFQTPVRGQYAVDVGGVVQSIAVETVVSFDDHFLLQVTKNNFRILSDVEQLSISLSTLMASQFDNVIKSIPASVVSVNKFRKPIIPPTADNFTKICGQIGLLSLESALSQGAGSRPDRFYSISNGESPIPHLPKGSAYIPDPNNAGAVAVLLEEMVKMNTQYNALMCDPEKKDKLAEAQQSWAEARNKVYGVIQRLVLVFEESMFKMNKYTRRKAHFRGSSLYLPGLIKAVITDFNYKKFFSVKASGGKRMYSVSLVLDVSLSMNGHLANCAIESLVLVISALQQIGIETFSIILFGETVQLIKSEEQEWNAAVIYSLLSNLNYESHFGTFDADAIETALNMASISQSRGPKTVFVFSDGYGTRGSLFVKALQRAENEGVEVIGVSVGFNKTLVPDVYQHYVVAAFPSVLPDAFQAYIEQEESEEKASLDEDNVFLADAKDTVESILANPMSVFPKLLEEMRGDRDLKLVKGNSAESSTTVDLCFVIDCTGSMAPYIKAVLEQVKGIVKSLIPSIQEKYPTITLQMRYGVVPYRDVCDATMPHLDFTNSVSTFENSLNVLKASGGGDLAEDALGAMYKASNLKWESNARFIIWIADAPAHGADCNGGIQDNHSGNPMYTVKQVTKILCEKNIDFVFCRVNEPATKVMENCLKAAYKELAPEEAITFTPVTMFDPPTQSSAFYHFVFVLDESGSMSGTPWKELESAYRVFLQKRTADQAGSGDYVSIVQFSSRARCTLSCKPITRAPSNLNFASGGTSFLPALAEANNCIRSGQGIPVLIFMSDGGSGEGASQCSKAVQDLKSQHPSLQVHMIGFGSGADTGQLQKMATAGGGKFHFASIGADLVQAFSSIAGSNDSALKQLSTKIGTSLSNQIRDKIIVDYL